MEGGNAGVPPVSLPASLGDPALRGASIMAIRPLAFGVRLRDPARGRTLRVRRDGRRSDVYVVEDEGAGEVETRTCGSAAEAVREVARLWRGRLN